MTDRGAHVIDIAQLALNMEAYPSFDPIGAMLIDASQPLRILIGSCETKETASSWIMSHLNPTIDSSLSGKKQPERVPLIGHGEILPGTPDEYTEYIGNKMDLSRREKKFLKKTLIAKISELQLYVKGSDYTKEERT